MSNRSVHDKNKKISTCHLERSREIYYEPTIRGSLHSLHSVEMTNWFFVVYYGQIA